MWGENKYNKLGGNYWDGKMVTNNFPELNMVFGSNMTVCTILSAQTVEMDNAASILIGHFNVFFSTTVETG